VVVVLIKNCCEILECIVYNLDMFGELGAMKSIF